MTEPSATLSVSDAAPRPDPTATSSPSCPGRCVTEDCSTAAGATTSSRSGGRWPAWRQWPWPRCSSATAGGTWWWRLGSAFVLTQLGFIAHDAGHHQICRRRRDNAAIGLVVTNLFTGFSFGWWLTKHNRHHAHTNRPGKDPDLAPGILVYTPDQADDRGRFGRGFARSRWSCCSPFFSSRPSTFIWPVRSRWPGGATGRL